MIIKHVPDASQSNRSWIENAWILFSVVLSIWWLMPRVEILTSSVADESALTAWAVPFAYFCIGVAILFVLSVFAFGFGYLQSPGGCLSLLSVIGLIAIADNIALVRYTLDEASIGGVGPDSVQEYWALTSGIRWVAWLAANAWFLLRSKKFARK